MSDTLASCETVSLGKLVLRLDRNGAFAREISVGGEELFRGIGFVVRDANWGTPVLTSDAILSRQNDRATVKSGGELDMSGGDLTWSAEWSITEVAWRRREEPLPLPDSIQIGPDLLSCIVSAPRAVGP
jgi:D-apionolactonase